jgi:acyl-CoA thioesterase
MSLPSIERVDGEFLTRFDDNWLQGRTVYGGASAAIALVAIKTEFSDLPPLRSMQIAFAGPLAHEVRASPRLLRRGKNSAFVSCDMIGSEGIGLRALFLFMAPRASTIAHTDLAAPPHDGPDTAPIDPAKLAQGFLTNFDLAVAGKRENGFLRWARLRDRQGIDAETELVAIADALPPAAMALAASWGPVSTTTWQLNLVTDDPTTRDGWWLLGAETLHTRDGASSQTMTIWNRDGKAVATATQSVALFI